MNVRRDLGAVEDTGNVNGCEVGRIEIGRFVARRMGEASEALAAKYVRDPHRHRSMRATAAQSYDAYRFGLDRHS